MARSGSHGERSTENSRVVSYWHLGALGAITELLHLRPPALAQEEPAAAVPARSYRRDTVVTLLLDVRGVHSLKNNQSGQGK